MCINLVTKSLFTAATATMTETETVTTLASLHLSYLNGTFVLFFISNSPFNGLI